MRTQLRHPAWLLISNTATNPLIHADRAFSPELLETSSELRAPNSPMLLISNAIAEGVTFLCRFMTHWRPRLYRARYAASA
jgi:hypothetical protein